MQTIEVINPSPKVRIGLYSAGLKAYWNQFDGLKECLEEYNKFIAEKLSLNGEVFNFGLIDDEYNGFAAGEYFNSNNVDIVFCHAATYFTSSTVLAIHQLCKAQVVILNLQPTTAMDYSKTDTAHWLAQCVACPIPELANVFHRANITHHIVNGVLGLSNTPKFALINEDTQGHPAAKNAWKEIFEWVHAATVKRGLFGARFGFLGGYYNGMLDMYSDFTMLQAQTGIHIEILEMCDLNELLQKIEKEEIIDMKKTMHNFFEISKDSPSDPIAKKPTEEQLEWSCKVAIAQHKLVKEKKLNALAYYYHGQSKNNYEKLQGGFIMGHSLLTAAGVPCAGEGDIKTAVAMKICDLLSIGGSYCEIVSSDFEKETILIGHDGPFHVRIAEQKPILRGMGLYHGKHGDGVSVEAKIKAGAVTTLGVTQGNNGRLKLIISEGVAIDAPVLMNGNTMTHVRFSSPPAEYMNRWFGEYPTHHFALSVGHNVSILVKVATLLNINYVII